MIGKLSFLTFDKIRGYLFFTFVLLSLCSSKLYALDAGAERFQKVSIDYSKFFALASAFFTEDKHPPVEPESSSPAPVATDPNPDRASEVVSSLTNEKKQLVMNAMEGALSKFQSASNDIPFLYAVENKIYQQKPGNPTSRKINVAIKTNDHYMAKLANTYRDLSSDGPRKIEEVKDLFETYLDRDDYFSERLRLEIDRQKDRISEDAYKVDLEKMSNEFANNTDLLNSATDPTAVDVKLAGINAKTEEGRKYLCTVQEILATIKDWIPPLITLFMLRQTLRLAKRKDERETKEADQKENIIIKPNDDEIHFYGP